MKMKSTLIWSKGEKIKRHSSIRKGQLDYKKVKTGKGKFSKSEKKLDKVRLKEWFSLTKMN